MQEVSEVTMQTPIEIALGVDKNGMTTARKLYQFLELKPANFSHWCRRNITNNEFAEENIDFIRFVFKDETPTGGKVERVDFKLTSKFARKLSMTQKNHKGEIARDYFTTLEDKKKEEVINRSKLSPQMQMLYAMMDEQAKQELEQQRIKEKQEKIEKKLDVVVATYEKNDSSDDFKQWCKNCAGKIAKSPKLESLSNREVFGVIWNESYQRLTEKRPCNLKTRLTNERGKAFERGKSSSWIKQHITYLSIIADDKDLKPAYESVMREMMMAYCVE
nr:MAG TPA: AntA/AntB antirepressor [Caudoviricetes sp.]